MSARLAPPTPPTAAHRARLVSPLAMLLGPALVVFQLISAPATARAQHSGDTGTAPPPPAGDGTIAVQIVNPDAPQDVAGLPIALYSLGTDGAPGFTSGETDAAGRVEFGKLSSDPEIVYLIGARYREIPFGERTTFGAGEKQALVEIRVSIPTDRIAGVRVEELRVRLDWMGDRVLVREILRLVNPGSRVIQLETGAIVTRTLATEARDFELGSSSMGDGLSFEDGVVRYVGPLYAGDQGIEYQYSLPIPKAGSRLRIPVELGQAAGRIVAVAGTAGMQIDGPGLIASSEVQSDSGKPLAAWARSGLAARERTFLEAVLPETREGADLVSIPRADVWLDLDDTRLTATADLQLEVAPGAPVAGTPERPLVSVTLPKGATLTGVAPEAEALGLIPRDHGGFDVVGPIGEGVTSLGYAYRLDARPEGVEIDLRFSRSVSTLNVLIADTGLALESSRLHRLRPFRSGTRNYLHREAFNVAPDETVDLQLTPLRARGLPREAGLAFAFASIAAAAAFLMAPLTKRARVAAAAPDADLVRLRAEREATYAAIADLDHDFETGKLERSDYTALRASLRERAIELLRAEQAGPAAATAAPKTTAIAASPPGEIAPASAPTARFCPSCGVARQLEWRFCAACGGALPEERPDQRPVAQPGRTEPGA